MKRNPAIALLAIASLFNLGNALAQDGGVGATVPFDFTVGGKLLPAATYRITQASPGIVRIQSEDGRYTAWSSTYADSNESAKGELVFDKYGNQYFLREIRCANAAGMNETIPLSKQEKKARTEQAWLNIGQQVEIVAK